MIVNNVDFTCLMSKFDCAKDIDTWTAWLVDSACTAHIHFDRALFATYVPLSASLVEMRRKAQEKVTSGGEVYLKLNVNVRIQPCKFSNLLQAPDFVFHCGLLVKGPNLDLMMS